MRATVPSRSSFTRRAEKSPGLGPSTACWLHWEMFDVLLTEPKTLETVVFFPDAAEKMAASTTRPRTKYMFVCDAKVKSPPPHLG